MRSFFFRAVLPPVASLLLCCVGIVAIPAAEKNASYQAALESIKAVELGHEVDVLADPAMEGREAGTRGGHAAGDYLVEHYARLHLRPAGDDGSFFQPFAPNFRNILALLPGSDPKLADQVIIVGAHYDHVGYGGGGLSRGPAGYIHPGADDNASGASAVYELAKAFTVLSTRPKRSILFAAWDAEEKGLLGSKYWLANPTIPLDRVIAAFNLDMIGWLRDQHVIVYGARSGYGWRRLLCSQNDAGLRLDFSWTLKPNADHYSFFDHGIPVLMLHTGLHDEYHRPSDVAKLINSPGMQQVTRLMFATLYELADRPVAAPAFRAAARYENPETEKALDEEPNNPADRLGVGWVDDAATTGGVNVDSITSGSPAERAGLRVGDRILRFAGRDIRTDDDFFAAVAAAESPALMTVQRAGEKKPLELKATLQGGRLRWGLLWRIDEAEPKTVVVTHVVPGSPAARAGLRVGDRIYQLGGRDFADEAAFARLANALPAPLQLLVERDGRLRTMVLQPAEAEPLRHAA